jgi:hypothetical protein
MADQMQVIWKSILICSFMSSNVLFDQIGQEESSHHRRWRCQLCRNRSPKLFPGGHNFVQDISASKISLARRFHTTFVQGVMLSTSASRLWPNEPQRSLERLAHPHNLARRVACARQALVDGKSGIIKMPSWADEVRISSHSHQD